VLTVSDPTRTLDRRTLLAGLVGAGTATLAGCSLTERGEDAETTQTDPGLASDLATRFAPTLYFDEAEPWFPTDPRPYVSEPDGEPIVDGFDAMNGYHERLEEGGEPPNRTVFYNAVEYDDSSLAVVQFWLYAAFDQFTANFHWHDWEVLHVFVDTGTQEPQLYVASSHSTRVPNNEFLDPNPDRTPRILSELGSHSSALSVNDRIDEFQRLDGADLLADITNAALEGVETLADLPLAYGLPRDEGGRLPYVVPEYEGAPVYDHERLPAVSRESLIDEGLTVRSLADLTSPPTDLPERATGVAFRHEDRDTADDVAETEYTYELVPTSELEDITDFTGPQLSFEFAVPQFAEDAVAGHITTAGVPWDQPRYGNPAEDITDPTHRAALAERYDAVGAAAPINTVVARIGEAVAADDAPDGEGLTTRESSVEAVALLESDSRVLPTFGGVAVAREVPAGDHRLTVNAAGQAPYSERLSVDGTDGASETEGEPETATSTATGDDTPETATSTDTAGTDGQQPAERVTAAGVDAEIPLVAKENARKLEVDADGTDAELSGVAVEDDFAGRLYDRPVDGSDALYVHRGGAYTTEVRDTDGAVGAFRVNPGRGRVLGSDDDGDDDDDDGSGADPPIRIDRPETGKASLSSFLVEIARETRDQAQAIVDEGDLEGKANGLKGLVRSLDAVIEAAERATENARAGKGGNADRQLRAVAAGIDRVVDRLDDIESGVPESFLNAVRNRADQAARRSEQAQRAEKL
jgi:hypothetical protein